MTIEEFERYKAELLEEIKSRQPPRPREELEEIFEKQKAMLQRKGRLI